MDAEYRDLLLAAEKRFQDSWYSWFLRYSFTSLRIVSVVVAKSVFVLRDGIILLLNTLYIFLLAPLDLCLVCIYFLAVNIRPDPDDDPDDLRYDPHKKARSQSGSMADLNIIRRLFWSGANVAIGKNLMTLSIPKSIYTKDTVLPGDEPAVEQQWRSTEIQPITTISNKKRPKSSTDVSTDEDDYIKSPEPEEESPKHRAHYGKRLLNNSRTQNLLYFLSRPNDTKALETYSKKIAGQPKPRPPRN